MLSWSSSFIFTEDESEGMSGLNILCLGALLVIGKMNHRHRSSMLEIDPITRGIADSQLIASCPNGPDIVCCRG
jgi:hypothetical protein